MTLIGLDLNATRARAVQGKDGRSGPPLPLGLPLEGGERELALALSLADRQVRVGRAGMGLCRRSPHLACVDFLPWLGDERLWEGGRHRLDAAAAWACVCEHLQRPIGRAEGVTVALPAYFRAVQAALLAEVAGRARWRVLGSVPSPAAVAWAAHDHLPWSDLAVVVEVDGYALTLSAVAARDDRIEVQHVHCVPRLGRGVWLGRLLDGAALRCIRLSRRDPRQLAETEQALFDQWAAVLDGCTDTEPAELVLQTPHWYQQLKFSPAELSALCAPLVQRTQMAMQQFLAEVAASWSVPILGRDKGGVGVVLLTAPAARLPGLAAAVEELIDQPDAAASSEAEDDDFGVGLIEEHMPSARVHVLDEDAVARAAFAVALRQQRGDLPRGHLDCLPLPGRTAAERGPTRLPFPREDQPQSPREHRERHGRM